MQYNIILSVGEKKTVMAILGELIKKPYDELNGFLGSLTIEEMNTLYYKLLYDDYCKDNNIKYEEMTYDDFLDYEYKKESLES